MLRGTMTGKTTLRRVGTVYDVLNRKGEPAGLLGPLYRRRGWRLLMFGRPPETFVQFRAARHEALKQAERY